MQTGIVQPSGPSSHFWISAGSVCARYTASGTAAKRLVTTTWRSPSVFSVILLISVCLSLFGFHGGQNVVEPVVIRGQGAPEHRKPLVDLVDGRRRQPARPFGAFDAAEDETCALEHLEVSGDGGLRHLEGLGQFHDGGFAKRQTRQNRPARRVGQRGEGGIEVRHYTSHISYITNL